MAQIWWTLRSWELTTPLTFSSSITTAFAYPCIHIHPNSSPPSKPSLTHLPFLILLLLNSLLTFLLHSLQSPRVQRAAILLHAYSLSPHRQPFPSHRQHGILTVPRQPFIHIQRGSGEASAQELPQSDSSGKLSSGLPSSIPVQKYWGRF